MNRSLIIIGNGFDRFHNINSSYWHFKEFLEEEGEWGFLESIEKYIDADELWCSFEYALGCLDYETLEEDNSCYMLSYDDDNWSDSAHHDYQYMIEQELKFANDIPVYLHKWLLSLETKRKALLSFMIMNNNNTFMNFNYTDTLEATYNINRKNIFYIHGKALEIEDLVVGHGNKEMTEDNVQKEFSSDEEQDAYYEYMSSFDVRELEAREVIRGYFRETYKDVDKIIRYNLDVFASYKGIDTVYVLGHSLAYVDLKYFEVINNIIGNNAVWIVTYFRPEEQCQHITQLMRVGVSPQQIRMCKMEQLCG